MKKSSRKSNRSLMLPVILLVLAAPLAAQVSTAPVTTGTTQTGAATAVSPQAQAVLDRMTGYVRGLKEFSIQSHATRDEIVEFGYKLQHNEYSEVTVQLPNKLRAEQQGDINNRTYVYAGTKLVMYSPDENVYARIDAPDGLGKLIGGALDAGIEIPMIDVLYQTYYHTLTENVVGGIWIGETTIEGAECDHLAFRQASADWQLWVEKGDQPLPRKIVITTRNEVGEPQYQVTMNWNLQPKIDNSTFSFTAPKDASEIPYSEPAALMGGTP
ncbi:MAG: DUF2092 domain-containing protein [Xanthomonadales bacterium]|nr:DUF2092 domain-containing protein [Xanthomonadales bacterium]